MNESFKGAKTEAAMKKRIAKTAAVLCASLPDELACKAMTDQKMANLLSATRAFMAECSLANNWDKEDAESYARALDFAEAAFEFASSAAPKEAASCGDAKRVCVRKCDDEDGYFCYFDCRLEYVTCLASVVVGARQS